MNDKDASKSHVLIVSQNPEDTYALVATLRNNSYSVSLAHSKDQAYAKAIISNPHSIILATCELDEEKTSILSLLEANPFTRKIPIINAFTLYCDKNADSTIVDAKGKLADQFFLEMIAERIRLQISFVNENPAGASKEKSLIASDEIEEDLNRSPENFKLKEDASDFIRRNINVPALQISDIAAYLNTSVRILDAAFDAWEGVSTYVFMRQERMRCAAKLLEQSSLKISFIANEVGYTNSGNFAKEFKKYWHQSPMRFRIESNIYMLWSLA
ncbi:hypothetical protein GCM10027276_33020 [Comamonas piscis]